MLGRSDQSGLEDRCDFHIVSGCGWASIAGGGPAEAGGRESGGQMHWL